VGHVADVVGLGILGGLRRADDLAELGRAEGELGQLERAGHDTGALQGGGNLGGIHSSGGPPNLDLRSDTDLWRVLRRSNNHTAQEVQRANAELTRRMSVRDAALPQKAPEQPIDIYENDHLFGSLHEHPAHTIGNHGPGTALRRSDAAQLQDGSYQQSLEGRIYGDSPWRGEHQTAEQARQSFSYRWRDDATMNRTINEYIRNNWDQIRDDLVLEGHHSGQGVADRVVGDGFYNHKFGTGQPREAAYGQTRMYRVVIRVDPYRPGGFYVHTAFPAGMPTP
jgi:hypothetical protein